MGLTRPRKSWPDTKYLLTRRRKWFFAACMLVFMSNKSYYQKSNSFETLHTI